MIQLIQLIQLILLLMFVSAVMYVILWTWFWKTKNGRKEAREQLKYSWTIISYQWIYGLPNWRIEDVNKYWHWGVERMGWFWFMMHVDRLIRNEGVDEWFEILDSSHHLDWCTKHKALLSIHHFFDWLMWYFYTSQILDFTYSDSSKTICLRRKTMASK